MAVPSAQYIREQVRQALAEDIGSGDLTAGLIPASEKASATVICRQQAVVAGQKWVDEVFNQIDPDISSKWHCKDGETVDAGSLLFEVTGNARHLLTAERTALNFLQTLSGVATLTNLYVQAVKGTGVNILDTRKTIPGLRMAQKYAVTCGGGVNHRIGLFDAVLIKENHINAAGSIEQALKQAIKMIQPGTNIEIEVESLHELKLALSAGATHLLLDNFSLQDLRQAVAIAGDKVRLEASGNVNLQTVRSIAETGVTDISVGELTKNVSAIDLSMRFIEGD